MQTHQVIGGNGTVLHVEETGGREHRSIVFINGYSTSGRGWIYQMDSPLAEDLHLVTMDTRGHGRSEKPPDGYDDPQLWADDIQAVIDDMALAAPVLVASSLAGAYVADYLTIHGADDIAGINLVGANSWLGTETARHLTGEDFLEIVPIITSWSGSPSRHRPPSGRNSSAEPSLPTMSFSRQRYRSSSPTGRRTRSSYPRQPNGMPTYFRTPGSRAIRRSVMRRSSRRQAGSIEN